MTMQIYDLFIMDDSIMQKKSIFKMLFFDDLYYSILVYTA